jgi:hypothetical protein
MNRSEVEQVLVLAERRDAVAEARERVRELESEVERDVAVEQSVPGLRAEIEECTAAIANVARELERQWVAQGPLVTLWTRAAEQLQLAESTDVDAAPYRADVAAAEHRVESARLATRDQRELLDTHRAALIGVLSRLPIDVEPPVELRDDARPEALRRDALALIESGDDAQSRLEEERRLAGTRLAVARAELSVLGTAADLDRELSELNARLPREVELPANAPPSMEMRLRRAGIAVTAGSRE